MPITTDVATFYYYPDVVVDWRQPEPDSLFTKEPRVIFEVLSPDTERIDRVEKLRNYQAIASLEVYAIINQHHIAVTIYRRDANGWKKEFLTAKEHVIEVPSIGCSLPLGAIYERTYLCR